MDCSVCFNACKSWFNKIHVFIAAIIIIIIMDFNLNPFYNRTHVEVNVGSKCEKDKEKTIHMYI